MTGVEEELIDFCMAAMQAVVPEVTSEQKILVREVLDGMLRERMGAYGRVETPPAP